MKDTVWRALLCSFVIFLLSCASCDYGARTVCLAFDELPRYGAEECGWYLFRTGWEAFGAVLFVASISVSAGGAVRLWREEMDGAADIKIAVLNLCEAGDDGATGETQGAAREEVPALPAESLTPEQTHPFAHFDERGRSRLERVLAED